MRVKKIWHIQCDFYYGQSMAISEKSQHHLITLYGDKAIGAVTGIISAMLPDKNSRILTPEHEDGLLQAARNSSLIIIVLDNINDHNITLVRNLKNDRYVVADVLAVVLSNDEDHIFECLTRGFDMAFSLNNCRDGAFRGILKQRLNTGGRRMQSFVLEQEYARINAALSSAPISLIVVDHEKRIVFISEHYFRAYPKSASSIARGMTIHDAFELIMKEELVDTESVLYTKLQRFWFNLNGVLEFSFDDGVSYRLEAVNLPGNQGTLVSSQNITSFVRKNNELQKALHRLAQNALAEQNKA